jgi:hypothetical protein
MGPLQESGGVFLADGDLVLLGFLKHCCFCYYGKISFMSGKAKNFEREREREGVLVGTGVEVKKKYGGSDRPLIARARHALLRDLVGKEIFKIAFCYEYNKSE